MGITGVEPVADSNAVELDPVKDAGGLHEGQGQGGHAGPGGAATRRRRRFFTDKGGKKFRYVVPMKFSRPDESGIIVKVDGSQTINFDIDESGKVTTGR